jgi:hypothetical protein
MSFPGTKTVAAGMVRTCACLAVAGASLAVPRSARTK